MLVVLLAIWGFVGLGCIGEAYYERDWPRVMAPKFAWVTLVVVLCFMAFS
jgi:hypothetical protein